MSLKHAVEGGLLFFLALYGVVLATGQTFGQRCTAMSQTGQAWRRCVDTLSSSATTFISEDVTKKEAAQASTPSN